MQTSLVSLYAAIPYQHCSSNPICSYEGYYGSVFYAAIASLGLWIVPEDVTNRGRADFTVFARERIFIFEFKVTENEDPLKQIKKRRYFEKYLAENQEIVLLGIVFDAQERNISQMEWEVLG